MEPERPNPYMKLKRRMLRRALYAGVIVVVALIAYTVYKGTKNSSTESGTNPNAAFQSNSFFESSYYGVFMDNNDVYFGRITKRDDQFVTLENTFYLRVTQVPQKTADGKDIALSSFDLIKVGTEVHKPKDKVELQVSHIISIQELDPSSQVIGVMNNYKPATQ